MYVIPTSWQMTGDKRRATPLLQDAFEQFADIVNTLITVENEGYAVVLLGKTCAYGRGIGWESGLALQNQIIEKMKEKSKGTFRCKHFTLNYERPTSKPQRARGVGGTFTENAFFFFKGTWATGQIPKPREVFGGTTWDDVWQDVPQCPDMYHCAVPAVVRDLVFDDIWSARGPGDDKPEEDMDVDGEAAQGGAAEEGAEVTPKKKDNPAKKAKAKKKSATKESAKKGKKDSGKKGKTKKSEKKGSKDDPAEGKQTKKVHQEEPQHQQGHPPEGQGEPPPGRRAASHDQRSGHQVRPEDQRGLVRQGLPPRRLLAGRLLI